MKRHLLILSVLCILVIILTGCSNNTKISDIIGNGKPERKHDSNKDDIKFLRIDWLTEKKDVDNIINNKFEKEYEIEDEFTSFGYTYHISYHNIEDKDIFRPHSWSAFGTKDLEGADYRACAFYKELYK